MERGAKEMEMCRRQCVERGEAGADQKKRKKDGRFNSLIARHGPSGDARGKIKNAARLAAACGGGGCCQWHRWRWRTSRRALRKISAQKVRTPPSVPSSSHSRSMVAGGWNLTKGERLGDGGTAD